MISTSVMIQLGKVKGNKMVDMQLSNNKLVDRGSKMIMREIGVNYETANSLLKKFGSVRKAIKKIMDKEKLIQFLMWISGFGLSIFLSISIYAGFNNVRKAGDYTILIIGLILIPIVFFCAYKGFRLLMKSIFDKK